MRDLIEEQRDYCALSLLTGHVNIKTGTNGVWEVELAARTVSLLPATLMSQGESTVSEMTSRPMAIKNQAHPFETEQKKKKKKGR